jgi:hypothetical protein
MSGATGDDIIAIGDVDCHTSSNKYPERCRRSGGTVPLFFSYQRFGQTREEQANINSPEAEICQVLRSAQMLGQARATEASV